MIPIISIVITTFNRKSSLLMCLDSLNSQKSDFSAIEVIIVNDGSTDGTDDLDLSGKYNFNCALYSKRNEGPSTARNQGVAKSNGKFVAFLEDDVIVRDGWLTSILSIISGDDVDVVEGRTVYTGTEREVRRYDAKNYLSFIPCNLVIRRTQIEDIGGFDPQFNDPERKMYFREDSDFGFRLLNNNARCIKDNSIIVEHPRQFITLKQSYRHAMRYQYDALLYKKHPNQFRKYIDVKEILGITIHRPHHYFFFFHSVMTLLLIFSLNYSNYLLLFIGGYLFLSTIIVQKKYIGTEQYSISNIFRIPGYIILPLIYSYAVVKGAFRYRSIGVLW